MKSPYKSIQILFLLPAAVSLLYIAAGIARLLEETTTGTLESLPFPITTAILTIVFIFISKKIHPAQTSTIHYAAAIPGFMAPMALFNAWTLAASHFGGVAWGGIYYFLEEITHYPDLGPFNSTVMLGMIAMLCASFLPAITAWGYLASWSKRTIYILVLSSVVAYISVAVNLDFNLWLAGLYGAEQDSLLFLLYGPVGRTLAIISICYLAVTLRFDARKN